MFGFEPDRRTTAERQRDFEQAEKRRQNALLARNMLNLLRDRLAADDGITVGLVEEDYFAAELLFQCDGVTYKLKCSVDSDD